MNLGFLDSDQGFTVIRNADSKGYYVGSRRQQVWLQEWTQSTASTGVHCICQKRRPEQVLLHSSVKRTDAPDCPLDIVHLLSEALFAKQMMPDLSYILTKAMGVFTSE